MLNPKNSIKTFLLFILIPTFSCFNTFAQVPKKIKTIIVDAGHGGSDAGARGEYEGTLHSQEKNITLAISNKLVTELKKQMNGVKIIPTRTSDVFNTPKEKAQFANDNHGDLFVCIHADAVALKTGSRIIGHRTENYTTTRWVGKGKKKKKIVTPHQREVPIIEYFKIPTTRKGTSTLIFAARKTGDKIKALENGDMAFETDDDDSSLNINYDSPEWKANALLYTQNYFKKSYKLGSIIQQEIANMGRPDLGVWQRDKGIWVLQATRMPAVLIETGFVANYEDERYLNSDKGQQEIAEAIAKALIKYKDQVENPRSVNNADTLSASSK
ncbi:MAG: N-acetylmuramoyl-L-alanine amidase [Chitinophagaceae bacterium]|nr:N-acetylmuramoyl-L-alanine amidase [Chitinophagaceae bacterium]